MDQIIIQDLLVRGIIGIHPWERETSQEILINIVVFADLSQAGISDNIDDSINYSTLTKKVQSHAEIAARFTVEALAEDIARLCLEDQKVKKVRVRVEKPGVVRSAKSVGIEIERKQTQ